MESTGAAAAAAAVCALAREGFQVNPIPRCHSPSPPRGPVMMSQKKESEKVAMTSPVMVSAPTKPGEESTIKMVRGGRGVAGWEGWIEPGEGLQEGSWSQLWCQGHLLLSPSPSTATPSLLFPTPPHLSELCDAQQVLFD